jgi:hypothetical protein
MLELAAARAVTGDAHFVASIVPKLSTVNRRLVERESEAALLSVVGLLWDNGWQPAELVRHARRTSAQTWRLVTLAVAADHARRAPHTLHPRWAAQIEALSLPQLTSSSRWLESFVGSESLDRTQMVAAVIETLSVCFAVGPLASIIPPPGSSEDRDGTRCWRATVASTGDDPILVKVRALLAQAESTTFEAEAATFTAKAQELMARHSIDAARAWAHTEREERPVTIRLPIDDPYANVKSLLLQVVADHSRCRAVYHDRYALSSVVGFAGDVAAAEMLYTSLLVQSQVALQAEGATAGPGGRTRSRSFRSSFLMAYTGRIDARLAEINAAVEADATAAEERSDSSADAGDVASGHGAGALLPVLAERGSVVDDEVGELFGELTTSRVRGGDDGLGWMRGRMAADRAQLRFADLDEAG